MEKGSRRSINPGNSRARGPVEATEIDSLLYPLSRRRRCACRRARREHRSEPPTRHAARRQAFLCRAWRACESIFDDINRHRARTFVVDDTTASAPRLHDAAPA